MVKTYKCQICGVDDFKYKCSACQVLYCSVSCYKIHKSTSCNGATSSSASIPTPITTADLAADPAPKAANSDALSHIRPLASLRWPSEPETSMFVDPLTRDDPKPLNHAQYLSIATSPKIRSLLSQNPRLPLILRSLDSLSPNFSRVGALETILGVATGRTEQIRLENGEYMDMDDLQVMKEFAEEVENAVRKPGDLGLAWEDPV